MNGVPEYYELKLKQTSKGIWYCDGVTFVNEAIIEAVILADTALYRIEDLLATHNKEAVKSNSKPSLKQP